MSVGPLGRSPGIGRAGGSIGHGPPHLLEQRERAPGARRVRPVREQHDEQIAIGIDPERRPRPPCVAVAARPEQGADARHGLAGRHGLPAERPRLGPAAEVHGLGREQPPAPAPLGGRWRRAQNGGPPPTRFPRVGAPSQRGARPWAPPPKPTALVVNSRTVSGRSSRRPWGRAPPRSTNCANRATSPAVEKRPALPETPPSLNALASFTIPATAWPRHTPVGAMRGRSGAGGGDLV